MTTVFDDTPKYPGLSGDYAKVTSFESCVVLRTVDTMAEEGVTTAYTPKQARALADALVKAANEAEASDD